MKQIVLFMLSAVLPLSTLIAQEAKKVAEPEYVGVVFHLDQAGTLTPLERQQRHLSTKVKALGFGGTKAGYVFKGSHSPIRFKVGQDIQFVVRIDAPGIEPDSLVNLDVLVTSKDERAILLAKRGFMAGGVKHLEGETLRPLSFSKYGETSLRFSPAQPLEPGEYVLSTRGGPGSFLFGIDPK